MNAKEAFQTSDFSVGFFKRCLDELIGDIRDNPFELVLAKNARTYAKVYASLQREIATGELRPVEETGRVGNKLLDQVRWDLALDFARRGNWKTMGEEIQKDAEDLLANPNSYEDVSKSYVLQELAEHIKS